MNTSPMRDLEQQLRLHYQQEGDQPLPSSAFWHTLADRLPAQNRPLTWQQRWLQAFPLSSGSSLAVPRRSQARWLLVACSLLLVVLLLFGVVSLTGLLKFRQSRQAQKPNVSNANALLLSQLLQSDPQASIRQLAQSNAFTEVHLAQAIGSDTVELQKVLADANEIVLGYTIEGSSNLVAERSFPRIILPGGQALQAHEVRYTPGASSFSPEGFVLHLPIAVLAYFSPGSLPGNPQQVNLQIAIPAGGDPVSFDVTVPFSAGKMVTLDQTATSHGKTITLERVVVTPSETRFYYRTGPGHSVLDPLAWELSIAGKTYSGNNGFDGGSLRGGENAENFEYALQSDTGTWMLNISTGEGTWQFTFTVS